VIQHGSHPHLRTGLSTCVDSPGTPSSIGVSRRHARTSGKTPHAGTSHDGWRTLARAESGSQASSQTNGELTRLGAMSTLSVRCSSKGNRVHEANLSAQCAPAEENARLS